MLIVLQDILSPGQALALCQAAGALSFGDGKATAGPFARAVKANDQALPGPDLAAIQAQVEAALSAHPLFRSAARPKALSRLILSRYRPGQSYGLHVDDALMGGLRSDLSFTLFLGAPEAYDGGALVIEDAFEARAIKLDPGALILYPSTSLHRVEPVTRGERLAVVGWVQSVIRDPGQREILFDLDRAIEASGELPGAARDLMIKTRSNLLRMWAEP